MSRSKGSLSANTFGVKKTRRRDRQSKLSLENLEARHLLAVVISEFMAANDSTLPDNQGNYSDWIELRNTGSQTADLTNWYLTDAADNLDKWQFPAVSLAADDHLIVFASGEDQTAAEDGLHTNFKLSSSGEYLALVQPDGLTVEFDYGASYPTQNDDVSYGVSENLNQQGYFTHPTPRLLNSVPPISDPSRAVVISEIMYDLPRAGLLDAENTAEEFIELHNRGFQSVNVGGWQFTRGVQFTLPDVSIESEGYLVVAANVESFQTKYPDAEAVVGGWTGTLSNNGETLELTDELGNRVDRIRYADEGDWSVRTQGAEDRGHTGWIWQAGHSGGNKSLELINLNQTNSAAQNWSSSVPDGGTPGARNSTAQENIAPLISGVSHSPPVPTSAEPVTVTASLQDELSDGIVATLQWRIDSDSEFQSTPMFDDGLHGDDEPNDGQFGAILAAQPHRTVIEFYVQASDASDQTRTWPAALANGNQKTNALYQVLDDIPALEPGDPPIYHQVMTTNEREEFSNVNRSSNAQFNATFIAVTGTGTDVRYNTGVRIRGSASRQDRVPNNRIRIPSDNPWEGLTRINLNARAPINQVSGSALFRLAGLPASDVHAVRMYSNGVDIKDGGFYVHAEALDGQFSENHFPADDGGNIYRGRRPNESPPGGEGAGLQFFGFDPAPYVSYSKSTNSSEADWSDVIDLTNRLNESPAETYVQDVQLVADVDQWFRAFAMNSLIDNNENGLFTGDRAGDDYAMYRGSNDTRFQMIPYDWDSLYNNVNRGIFRPTAVPALDKLINHPEFLSRYYGQYIDLIDNVILTDHLKPTLIEALGDITSQQRINDIEEFLINRANSVRARINERLTFTVDLPTQNGLPRTQSPILNLTGNAPVVTTKSVLINGESTDVLQGDGSWSISASAAESDTLLETGATWRYLDDGSDQGDAWRESNFDDSSWAEGAAQLGYGDGDETTTIGFGDDEENRYITSYFRKNFEVDDPSEIESLSLDLLFDDGAAVYINGQEVARLNLADDATFETTALDFRGRPQETEFVRTTLANEALEALQPGTNVIAIEVHQASPSSSDTSMDAKLTALMDITASEGLQVMPGVNRVVAEAYDGPDGSGNKVASELIDIWYDSGTMQEISDSINTSQTWKAADGPYRISGNVVIDQGALLAIEPGTTVFFADDAKLTVRGQLMAIGAPHQEIRFTREPGGSSWDGIQFRNSQANNLIQHAILEYGVTDDGLIGLENSQLTIEQSTLDHASRRRIRSINSSLIVRNSVFTNITDPGEAPPTDNRSEHVWGRGIPEGGHWILEGNDFGHITGHNDSVDFDAPKRPDPIPIIRNNTFRGGGDDALDMTGDVYIEGNLFQNFIKDEFNTDPGESNTISASDGDFWVLRNVFDNVQHASLVKEEAYMHFFHNTVASSSFSPLYFDLPGQTSGPGRGANVQGSIFVTEATTFGAVTDEIDLQVEHSFLPVSEFDLGTANRYGNPHLGTAAENYALLTGSPAIGSGPNGVDMGARISGGPILTGVPRTPTADPTATIRVGGAGITQYRFRLNDFPWSPERSVSSEIELSGLEPGNYTISVIGRDALGQWQDDTDATTSHTWQVDPTLPGSVRLNEILTSNTAAYQAGNEFPDVIELYNDGGADFDLSGFRLSDRLDVNDKFIFPAGSVIAANEYLILTNATEAERLSLSFDLDAIGEAVYLFDASGQVVDSISFGQQLNDRSIGIVDDHDSWNLNLPTIGAPNQAAPLASVSELKINEWFAASNIRFNNDFVELYNPQTEAVALGGLWLTDEASTAPNQYQISELSFIDGSGYVKFIADNDVQDGVDHTNFKLSSTHEHLALLTSDLQFIDQVFYYPQTTDVSQGRIPDGGNEYGFLPIPTRELTNNQPTSNETSVLQFSWDATWRYEPSGGDLGTAWREPDFDDSQWESGIGLLGNENERLPEQLETEFPLGDITYYFRKQLEIDENPADLISEFSTIIDDGAIVYINGQEVLRLRMPNGEIDFEQTANGNVNEAQLEGPFAIPAEVWTRGANVIAVEVHQVRQNSSDLVFGMDLAASVISNNPAIENQQAIVDGLRITEIMYNPADSQSYEFIELQNLSDSQINLQGVRIAGAIDFEFPAVSLPVGERVVIANDSAAMLQRYGSGINLAGQYSGQLSNGSEELILRLANPFDAGILRFEYDSRWASSTDGLGRSLEVVDPTTSFSDWGEKTNWQASVETGGTPGFATGPAPNSDDVVINEILSHTDLPLVDSIELFNRSDINVDLSGWYLSDSQTNLFKYQLPEGSELPANGYLVLDETNFNPTQGADANDFSLDAAHGDSIWLWKADSDGKLHRIIDTVEFGATANAESLGRVPNGDGEWSPLLEPSFGAANGAARVGPILISEVNYHPQDPSEAALQIDPLLEDDDLEFVEILNPTTQTLNLTNWRIRKGIDFDFADDTVIRPRQALLVVPFDPSDPANSNRLAAFRAHYGLPNSSPIVGGYDGKLDNGGDTLQLQRPDGAPLEEPNFIPRLLEDEIRFDDASPWPESADGGSDSLQRQIPGELGRLVASWTAAAPTPGEVPGISLPGDFNGDGIVEFTDIQLFCEGLQASNLQFDLNDDQLVNDTDRNVLINDILGTTVGDANLDRTFNSSDLVVVFVAGEYEDAVDGNSTWAEGDWNCDGDFDSSDVVLAFQEGRYSVEAVIQSVASKNSIAANLFSPAVDTQLERTDKLKPTVLRATTTPRSHEVSAAFAEADSLFEREFELDDQLANDIAIADFDL